MSRFASLFSCSAFAAGLMIGPAGAVAAEALQPAAAPAAASPAPREIALAPGKSQVLELPSGYGNVMIADPKIADVLPTGPRSIYIVGKAPGSTTLTIYGSDKQLLIAADVVVAADADSFKARLAEVMPQEARVSVRSANQSLVLSGAVSSPAVLQRVLALAETYAPGKVVNLLGVEGVQQVMLSVRFVEMNRTLAKDLRINLSNATAGRNPIVSVFTGDTLVKNGGALLDSFGSVSLLFNNNMEVLLDALEQRGLIHTLAEPTLVAMSGDTANFLAGGEFPIPVAQTSNGAGAPTITVAFKQFGVGLAFTPTILGDGMVNIVVDPEVSNIDPTVSVDLGLIKVPGIKVRRAHTTVELREGQSFTIAGLLKDDYMAQIRQYPFIGDIPILGALVRSNGFTREETELVIVVTPHLAVPRRAGPAAAEQFTPPSDFERFLLGWQKGVGAQLSPVDRALLSSDIKEGGVDGPHGHVLY